MALNISDAGVNISITKETRSPSKAGFGSLLFLNPIATLGATRLTKYTSLKSVAAVYSATDEPYKAALKYYSQKPSPTKFYVGDVLEGVPSVPAQPAVATLTLTGTASDTLSSNISLDAEDYAAVTITSGVTTGADIVLEFEALINANGSSAFTATSAGDVLTVTTKATGLSANSAVLALGQFTTGINTALTAFAGGADVVPATSGENLSSALDAILNEGDFYAVMPTAHFNDVETDIVSIASWCEANERVLFNTTANSDFLLSSDTTSIAYVLKQAGYDFSLTAYNAANEYLNASAFGRLATVSYSGTETLITLKFKDMPGITVSDLNPNQLSVAKTKNGNVFYETASIRMFDDGITAGGSWIDDIIGMHALAEEIRVNVFGLLARTGKVPLNESGVSLIEAEVVTALDRFERNGFLTHTFNDEGNKIPAYNVFHIPVFNLSAADRASRTSPDVEFEATIAGAVHNITVTGTLVL